MPLAGFKGLDSQEITFENAPQYFDDQGLAPAEVVSSIIRDDAGRGPQPYLSPSILNADTTCRREIVISRFIDYFMDPLSKWMAVEGTTFHDAFIQVPTPGWDYEVALPADPQCKCGADLMDNLEEIEEGLPAFCGNCREVQGWRHSHGDHRNHPNVKRCEEDGKLRLELFPGHWMKMRLDRLRADKRVIVDFKTKRNAKVDRWKQDMVSWAIQLNCYRRAVHLLYDVPDVEMWVWRIYRGAYDADRALRKFEVPVANVATMELLLPHIDSLAGFLRQAWEVKDDKQALLSLVKTIPADGVEMFNRKKCLKYCQVEAQCPAEGRRGVQF